MADYADVCVLIPTLNEAETIGDVIDEFRAKGFENILVVDGHSTDETRDIAREHDARVIEQTGSGKGQAVREGVEHVDAEYVLMLDGDGTYCAKDAPTMLEPILYGDAEHVIGDRFADMEEGAMTSLNKIGNRIFNWFFRHVHGKRFEDILSGYRAFTRDSFERMYLTAEGFGIETEMAVECAKNQISTRVVPITYKARPAGSETNLHPVKDGARILLTLYSLAKTSNPLFYFGSVGGVSTLFGVLLGLYVGVEWFVRGVSHEVIAVVSALGIIFGVQLLMFGLLSDLVVSLHREQMRRLKDD